MLLKDFQVISEKHLCLSLLGFWIARTIVLRYKKYLRDINFQYHIKDVMCKTTGSEVCSVPLPYK